MAVKAQGDVPDGMQRVYRRFERWRSSHRGRLPIPTGLWASAAVVARERGVFQTAKVLRLEYAPLKRMVESAPGSAQTAATPATFLELTPSQAVRSVGVLNLIELEGPRGKIRIQWKGAAASDLAALSARCGSRRDSVARYFFPAIRSLISLQPINLTALSCSAWRNSGPVITSKSRCRHALP